MVAAETISGAETMALGDYRMMPRATFCQPQVASFGLTEEQAKEEGYDVEVASFRSPRTARRTVWPTRPVRQADCGQEVRRTAGGHLIGPDVSELLPELTLAQKWDLTAYECARNVHTIPRCRRRCRGVLPRPGRSTINF